MAANLYALITLRVISSEIENWQNSSAPTYKAACKHHSYKAPQQGR